MRNGPEISRRRAIGLGLGVAAFLAVDPARVVAVGTADAATADEACDPVDAPRVNLVSNPSFEDGPVGPTAPGWTFQ